MSSPTVLAALRTTSKGRLSYKSQFDNDVPEAARKKYLDELSSPPSMSPESVLYISERAKRLSLDSKTPSSSHGRHRTPTPLSHTPSPLHTPHTLSTHHTPRGRGYTLNTSDDETDNIPGDSLNDMSIGISPIVTMATTSQAEPIATEERSVLDDLHQEIEGCVESIDDRLLAEMAANIQYRRRLFKREMDKIQQRAREEAERFEKARQRKLDIENQQRRAREEQERIEVEQKEEALKEQFRLQAEIMEAKIQSGEEQKMEIMKKIVERRRKAVEKLMSQCQELIHMAFSTESKFSMLLKSCSHTRFLSRSVMEKVQEGLLSLKDVQGELVREQQSGQPDNARLANCHAHLTGLGPLLAELKTAVDDATLKGESEAKQQQLLLEAAAQKLEAEKKAKEDEKKAQEEEKKREEEKKKQENEKAKDKSGSGTTGLHIPKSMLESYTSLQDKLTQTLTTCTSLTAPQDSALKKYRFDLQRAITGTINSVSANSGQDLIEKILHLKRLLSGQSVPIGTKSVNVGGHPDAKLYCFNLLAAKIVKQGEGEVASNTQAAFPLAALTIGIWTEFEELGHYLLAHFYSMCPVLVPMYVSRTKDMSEAEYMKSMGYKVSKSDVVESQDLFLNRVRGTVRLYAAIIQTPQLPMSQTPPPHPHGLEHGWAWLARMLNLEPDPLTTSAALGDFLEIAGHALMKKYSKQFQKLLYVLWKEYIPKIEKVTPQADRGPLARLTQYLEDCIAAGKIPEPKGCLTDQFWRTRSHGVAIA